MSKIGKKTITITKESKVTLNQDKLLISGPKGSHEVPINAKIFSAEIKENLLNNNNPKTRYLVLALAHI